MRRDGRDELPLIRLRSQPFFARFALRDPTDEQELIPTGLLPLSSLILIQRLTEPIATKLGRIRRTGPIAWLSLAGLTSIA